MASPAAPSAASSSTLRNATSTIKPSSTKINSTTALSTSISGPQFAPTSTASFPLILSTIETTIPPPASTQPASTSDDTVSSNAYSGAAGPNKGLIIGVSVGGAVVVLLAIVLVASLIKRRQRRKEMLMETSEGLSPKDRGMDDISTNLAPMSANEPPILPELNFERPQRLRKRPSTQWFNPSAWFGQGTIFDSNPNRTPTPTPTLPDWGQSVLGAAHRRNSNSTEASNGGGSPPNTPVIPPTPITVTRRSMQSNRRGSKWRVPTFMSSSQTGSDRRQSHASLGDIINRYRSFYGPPPRSDAGASHLSGADSNVDVEEMPPRPSNVGTIHEDDEDEAPLGRIVGKLNGVAAVPLPAGGEADLPVEEGKGAVEALKRRGTPVEKADEENDDLDRSSMEAGIGVAEVIGNYDRHRSQYTINTNHTHVTEASEAESTGYPSEPTPSVRTSIHGRPVETRQKVLSTVSLLSSVKSEASSRMEVGHDAPPLPAIPAHLSSSTLSSETADLTELSSGTVTSSEAKKDQSDEDKRPMSWTSQASSVPSSVLEAEAERQGFGTFGRR
ncbi:hypothetical protein HDU97_000745 [Phlyctochytrium planicorne]|nr:hypothetical protein HDU97_000745 [Phlyctochytrium planicorne]